MSYEITMRKANCLYEGVEDPVFVTITSSSSDVALLSRSDALELAAAHEWKMALESIAKNGCCDGCQEAARVARAALAKAEGKEQA